MQYNSKSLTRDGATAFAKADATQKGLVLDKLVVSERVIAEGTDISALTLDDFTNSKQFDANNVYQNQNTFTVTSVITNAGMTKEFSLSMIGIIGHIVDDTTQYLIAIVLGNDPFKLPVDEGTPFRFIPSLSIGYSATQNVTIQVNDDVYITQADIDGLLNAKGYSTTDYVDKAINAIPKTDLSDYDTSAQVNDKIAAIPKPDLTAYDTSKQVSDKIAAIPKPDLTPYANKTANNEYTGTNDFQKATVKGVNVATTADVNTKQDKIGYTPADDSKVAHLSGTNNFDTVPTVKNNPLLLASSLPSDLARTGQDTNFTGKLQKSGIDVATTTDVTNAVNTATANMADTTKPANFTAGLQSGGIDVATAADLKSVEASAWKLLVNSDATTAFYRLVDGTLYISGYARVSGGGIAPSLTIVSQLPTELQNKVWTIQKEMTVGSLESGTAYLYFGGDSSLSVSCSNQGNQVPSSIVVFNNSYKQS